MQFFVDALSKKMIDQRLKELETRGMVERKVINDRPVAVTYELTEFGRSALKILEDLRVWSEANSMRLPSEKRWFMNKAKLTKEEQKLLDAVEAGEFESVLTESRRKELESVASNTFRKDKRINIRISNRDLAAIQSRALQEGMPYQTFVSSIIHKYISGSLQDLTANKQSQSDA